MDVDHTALSQLTHLGPMCGMGFSRKAAGTALRVVGTVFSPDHSPQSVHQRGSGGEWCGGDPLPWLMCTSDAAGIG